MTWTKRTTPAIARDVELADDEGNLIHDEDDVQIIVASGTAWTKR